MENLTHNQIQKLREMFKACKSKDESWEKQADLTFRFIYRLAPDDLMLYPFKDHDP